MTSSTQKARLPGLHENPYPHTPMTQDQSKQRFWEKITDIEMRRAATAIGIVAVALAAIPSTRQSIKELFNLSHPDYAAQLASAAVAHPNSILSIRQDVERPNIRHITYKYRPYHATEGDLIAETVGGEDIGEAQAALKTWGITENVHVHDVVSFDEDVSTGRVVPRPDHNSSAH